MERNSDGRCGRLQHGGGGNDQRKHSNGRKAQGTTITTNYALYQKSHSNGRKALGTTITTNYTLYCTVPEILAIFIQIDTEWT